MAKLTDLEIQLITLYLELKKKVDGADYGKL